MKKNIHPKYYPKAKAICACGNSFTVGSTKPELKVEMCSACHPFFTGTEKVMDTAGRVEKFKARQAKAVAPRATKTSTLQAKKVRIKKAV